MIYFAYFPEKKMEINKNKFHKYAKNSIVISDIRVFYEYAKLVGPDVG